MKKIYLYGMLFILFSGTAMAQGNQLRGMYIDGFVDIFGNQAKEDSLLQYAQDSSFNYLALYDIHAINLLNPVVGDRMGVFIKRARDVYGITYVGAVGETFSTFSNKVGPYNMNRSDDHEKFNVFNLEFEFWTASSVNPGGYYCQQYLQQAGCACDTSGAFDFFIEQMHKIDSLATVQQVISETYLGWFNQGQAQEIQRNVDRILLHAYRQNTSTLWSYSTTRLSYLASNNVPVDIAPIFSSEPIFMGPWLETNSQFDAFAEYEADYLNDNSPWKQYINIIGYQWFDWGYMPKPVAPYSASITMNSNGTLCTGDTVTLTATQGDSYLWSTGATTRSISTGTGGAYSCEVTYNGTVHSAQAVTLVQQTSPTVGITEAPLVGSVLTLTANANSGSGSISSYQWKINSTNINGATASIYDAVTSGNYSVQVTNSAGCSVTSSMYPVTIPGTCTASIPTGLNSTQALDQNIVISWAAGQTGDSLVIRYHPDTSSDYEYVRLVNTGQTSYILTNLLPGTLYSWRIKTVCGVTSSAYSSKNYFTTPNVVGLKPELTASGGFLVYPNPAKAKVFIGYIASHAGNGQVTLMDMSGKLVKKESVQLVQGENNIALMLSEYKDGIYTLSIKTDTGVRNQKLVIDN